MPSFQYVLLKGKSMKECHGERSVYSLASASGLGHICWLWCGLHLKEVLCQAPACVSPVRSPLAPRSALLFISGNCFPGPAAPAAGWGCPVGRTGWRWESRTREGRAPSLFPQLGWHRWLQLCVLRVSFVAAATARHMPSDFSFSLVTLGPGLWASLCPSSPGKGEASCGC